MNTCYVFAKDLDAQGCTCLLLNQSGDIINEPKFCTFSEIAALQKDSKTIVVESSAHLSFFTITLPWLPERKARIAIPFALEDKLAQSIDELHFSFDRQHYQNNQYLVAVIRAERMQTLMQQLNQAQIHFDTITADWFALNKGEILSCNAYSLVHNEDFKGELSMCLSEVYAKNHPEYSLISLDHQTAEYPIWIAQRLHHKRPLNLCQGSMQQNKNEHKLIRSYKIAGALCALWLFSLLFFNALDWYSLNKKTKQVDEQIAVIYHQFFPEAKQVISPKFRISQLLETNSQATQTRFWTLVNQVGKHLNQTSLQIDQMLYQNKILSISIQSADFSSLEELQKKLKQNQIQVKQTQAATHEKQVIATLELS